MKQEIIADLSRITEEEQAILDGKTEVEKERYSSGQKFVMDAGKLLERGKLIDIRPHTRFIRFPAHSHNYVEMIYMCQGSTVHTINGERIELKTGELLILNQNAVQEIEPAGRDDIAVNFLISAGVFRPDAADDRGRGESVKGFYRRLSEKRGGTALLSALQNRGCPSGAESDRKSRLDALTSPEQ